MSRFAYGVDLGWASQLESEGWHWINEAGQTEDILTIMQELGVNAVRLRLFVNPPENAYWGKDAQTTCMLGFCDTRQVIAMGRRIQDAGMRLMLDFHYSDRFADPQYQTKPEAWKDLRGQEMGRAVYEYTRDTMAQFRDAGVIPTWVQVGNEINSGILLPEGSFREHPGDLVFYLNAGYRGVKEIFPDCIVITHLAMLNMPEDTQPYLDNFFAMGGQTDLLGFSYYPYWYNMFAKKEDQITRPGPEYILKYLKANEDRYHKPVMIVETGGDDQQEDETYQLLVDCIRAAKMLPDKEASGVFYWEPEVSRDVVPDHYPLGAAKIAGEKTIQFTKALTAYRDEAHRT